MATPVVPVRRAYHELIRIAAVGVLAGLAAGCVSGIAARLAMRIVALAAGHIPAFTLPGTIAIIMQGTVLGAPIGLLYVALRNRLPKPGLIGGATLGLLLMLLFTIPFAAGNDELVIAPKLGTILFAALFPVAGATVGVVTDLIEQRVPGPRRGLRSLGGYATLLGLGVAGIAIYIAIVVAALLGINI